MSQKSNLPLNLASVASIAIIVAFFLPWYLRIGAAYSGFDIPEIVSSLKQATSLKSWTGRFDYRIYLVYALYLIPLGAIATIALSVLRQNYRLAAWPTAVIPLAGFLYGLVTKGQKLLPKIGIGGWITISAALVILLALVDVLRLPGKGR